MRSTIHPLGQGLYEKKPTVDPLSELTNKLFRRARRRVRRENIAFLHSTIKQRPLAPPRLFVTSLCVF